MREPILIQHELIQQQIRTCRIREHVQACERMIESYKLRFIESNEIDLLVADLYSQCNVRIKELYALE